MAKSTQLRAMVGLEPQILTVQTGSRSFAGRVLAPPAQVRSGDEVHLRVKIGAGEDWADVLTRVRRVGGVAPSVPWGAGLALDLEIVRTARGCEALFETGQALVGNDSVAVEESDPGEMVGSLKHMPLADLLQTMELMQKTARVEVTDLEGASGVVHVERGAVVDAQMHELGAMEAFTAMVGLARGRFQVRFGCPAPRRSLEQPTSFLLLEAMRKLDEDAREPTPTVPGRRAPAPVEMADSVPAPWPDPAAPAPVPVSPSAPFGRFFAEAGRIITLRSVRAAAQLPPDDDAIRSVPPRNPFHGHSNNSTPPA
ncbi:MAG: DUF4388 domain-containing protein [Deltaproteobacteria bacterium]|nr:DUF4388 domain-containing protein [Deltaproteobacteria bacterium]